MEESSFFLSKIFLITKNFEYKKSRSKVDGWVSGFGQIGFYILLSSELSLDSESKFEPSVAILPIGVPGTSIRSMPTLTGDG